MYISDFLKGRDNNFNLIRVFLALIVFFAHGFNIYTESPITNDPILLWSFRIGFFALYAFFILSGFMITASVFRCKSLINFGVARILRIFPGLLVVTIAVTFIIGPIVTKLSITEYFTSLQTYQYLAITSLTTDPHQMLPSVFMDHGAVGAVNRPIWTLRYELVLYLLTAFVFAIGLFKYKRLCLLIGVGILSGYIAKGIFLGNEDQIGPIDHLARFTICFAIGSLAWLFKDKIPLRSYILALSLIGTWSLYNTSLGELCVILTIAYAVFYLAYVPNGKIRNYNRIGDYSFGIYIIHWPVASWFLAFYPELVPMQLIPLTAIVTIPLAVLCWHFVESPCLKRKKSLSRWIETSSMRLLHNTYAFVEAKQKQ